MQLGIVYNITRENAKELSRKGLEARRAKKLARLNAKTIAEQAEEIPSGDFRGKILIRVRMNIEETMAMLEKEDEPKARESLSRSLGVLLEHEGHLSGRPKSPMGKIVPPKPQRRINYPEPEPEFSIMHDTTPVVAESTTNTTVQGDWTTVLF